MYYQIKAFAMSLQKNIVSFYTFVRIFKGKQWDGFSLGHKSMPIYGQVLRLCDGEKKLY